jgi:hypothetical protein
VAETMDWHDWHSPYADDASALSRRLRIVQRHIGDWLDQRPESSAGKSLTRRRPSRMVD